MSGLDSFSSEVEVRMPFLPSSSSLNCADRVLAKSCASAANASSLLSIPDTRSGKQGFNAGFSLYGVAEF